MNTVTILLFFHSKSLNIIFKKKNWCYSVLKVPNSFHIQLRCTIYSLTELIFLFFSSLNPMGIFFFSPTSTLEILQLSVKFYRSFKLTSSAFQNFPFSLIDFFFFFFLSCFPWLSYLSFWGLETLSWNGVPITHLSPMHNLWQLPFAL